MLTAPASSLWPMLWQSTGPTESGARPGRHSAREMGRHPWLQLTLRSCLSHAKSEPMEEARRPRTDPMPADSVTHGGSLREKSTRPSGWKGRGIICELIPISRESVVQTSYQLHKLTPYYSSETRAASGCEAVSLG